jgi:DNA polymerase III epsilon subunit-like protein
MSRMHLIFDTETTGLPPRNVSPELVDQWNGCRVVEFAWQMLDGSSEVEQGQTLIRPEGFTIPDKATQIHGISTEEALQLGISHHDWIQCLELLLPSIKRLVAHNIAFDVNVVAAELYRAGRADLAEQWLAKERFCTMLAGTLPRQRWPRLADLYCRLFGEKPEGVLHRAAADVAVCRRIYEHLAKDL